MSAATDQFHGKRAYEDYCPYTETSKDYDKTRAPLGLNIAFGTMAMNSKPLSQQDLLDVGCGTGTFLMAAKGKLGTITGIDYNEGMLEQAKARVGDVKLLWGSADQLPFPDNSFDVCTMNQVLHHFPNDKEFSFLRRAAKEMARVLRPGGRVVISTSAPEQQRDGFWWLELFPGASDAVCGRFPPISTLLEILRDAGLVVDADSVVVPIHRTLMSEHAYLKKHKHDLLSMGEDPSYRNGDSSWAMVENVGELESGLTKLRKMVADGTADAWLQGREDLRKKVGQATFVCAMKA